MGFQRLKKHQKFAGLSFDERMGKRTFYTQSIEPGKSVYGERVTRDGDYEFREWNPYRSKMAAAIHNNCRRTHLEATSNVLYLGASSGTTVSHFSDICAQGLIYAVEFAHRSIRELLQNLATRENVIPLYGDANHPYEYARFILTEIDVLYQDIAQPNQSEIAIKNAQWFLKPGGSLIYAVKARSIDVSKSPSEIFETEIKALTAAGFDVMEDIRLEPFTADHVVIFARYNPQGN
jgi:fibrillarin-like pre-rRNA processing protein